MTKLSYPVPAEPFKVMLAASITEEELDKLRPGTYRVQCKWDGIRAIFRRDTEGVLRAFSRTGKVIPRLMDAEISLYWEGREGELLLPDSEGGFVPDASFSEVQSYYMTRGGKYAPNWHCRTFGRYGESITDCNVWEKFHLPEQLKELRVVIQSHTNINHEGVMLARLGASYKHGRSTIKHGGMIKLKFKKSDDFEIQDMLPLEAADGTRQDLLGSFICATKGGVEFSVGSGLTFAQRKEFMARKAQILRDKPRVNVEFMDLFPDTGIPRQPIFRYLREAE